MVSHNVMIFLLRNDCVVIFLLRKIFVSRNDFVLIFNYVIVML